MGIVANVFGGEVLSTGQIRSKRAMSIKGPRVHRGETVVTSKGNTARKKTPTLSAQFKSSLAVLIERMTACEPHFVR